MKKLVGILAGILTLMLIAFCGCSTNKIPERPEDWTPECWIAENVTEHEWSENSYVEAGCGFVTHYDREILRDEKGKITTECYVEFDLELFSSNEIIYIKQILVKDPAITAYGLSYQSSYEEFDAVFSEKGYKIVKNDKAEIYTASKNGIEFGICKDWSLWISVEDKEVVEKFMQ